MSDIDFKLKHFLMIMTKVLSVIQDFKLGSISCDNDQHFCCTDFNILDAIILETK